ncbi:MAG: hypothetical protein JSS66_07625 [Armatimonadetes bacterium]|nr:hypothetical protein [Armatimonadota bacterium]
MEWVDNVDFVQLARDKGVAHLVFSANAVVNNRGLVMGAGAALRVRDEFLGSDLLLGVEIKPFKRQDYLVASVCDPDWNPSNIHALQVKRHYKQDGDFELCTRSLRRLVEVLGLAPAVMNCPLVGRGGHAAEAEKVYRLVEKELKDTHILVTRQV